VIKAPATGSSHHGAPATGDISARQAILYEIHVD
jgi:hypothetical protein